MVSSCCFATGEARAGARRAASFVVGKFFSIVSASTSPLDSSGQGRFVNEASKKILEKRGHQSSAVEAVKPLDAEIPKPVPALEQGLETTEMAADVVKQETQSSLSLVETTDQPLPTTEASTPASLSKPAAKSKTGSKSTIASEKKRIPSSNEVILFTTYCTNSVQH